MVGLQFCDWRDARHKILRITAIEGRTHLSCSGLWCCQVFIVKGRQQCFFKMLAPIYQTTQCHDQKAAICIFTSTKSLNCIHAHAHTHTQLDSSSPDRLSKPCTTFSLWFCACNAQTAEGNTDLSSLMWLPCEHIRAVLSFESLSHLIHYISSNKMKTDSTDLSKWQFHCTFSATNSVHFY